MKEGRKQKKSNLHEGKSLNLSRLFLLLLSLRFAWLGFCYLFDLDSINKGFASAQVVEKVQRKKKEKVSNVEHPQATVQGESFAWQIVLIRGA